MLFRYHLFFDRRQLMSLFFTAFSGWLTVIEIQNQLSDGLWWLLWGILALAMAALSLGLPCLYIMTPKGLHIIHALGLIRRFIPWDTVEGLEIRYDHNYSHKSLPYIFDTFAVYGDAQGPDLFFTEDEMVRTLRARILLERYTGLKVEGFLLDDLRDGHKRRKEKRERMHRHRKKQKREARGRRAGKARRKEGK